MLHPYPRPLSQVQNHFWGNPRRSLKRGYTTYTSRHLRYGTACIYRAANATHGSGLSGLRASITYRSPQCKNRREVSVFNMQDMCCTLIPGIWSFLIWPQTIPEPGVHGPHRTRAGHHVDLPYPATHPDGPLGALRSHALELGYRYP